MFLKSVKMFAVSLCLISLMSTVGVAQTDIIVSPKELSHNAYTYQDQIVKVKITGVGEVKQVSKDKYVSYIYGSDGGNVNVIMGEEGVKWFKYVRSAKSKKRFLYGIYKVDKRRNASQDSFILELLGKDEVRKIGGQYEYQW